MNLHQVKKVTVVGAGAVGLASAYYLRKTGCEVTVIDPAPLAAKASGHNAGWVIPSMSTPVPAPGVLWQALRWILQSDSPLYVTPSLKPSFIDFMLRMLCSCTSTRFQEGSAVLASLSAGALAQFDELAADGVQFESHEEPLTMLFTNPHKFDMRVKELQTLDGQLPGFSWEHMDVDGLRLHMPSLAHKVVAGIASRGDRSVDPASLVRGLADACQRDGVEILLGSAASLEKQRGGQMGVKVNGNVLTSDRVVVAAGAWTQKVLAGIGEHLPLQAGKGYGYDLPVTVDAPTAPLYLAEARVAVTPFSDRIRVAGTMGIGGIDESIKRRRAEGILTGASAYFEDWPDVTGAPTPWLGLRPMTPDGVPIIGPLSRHPNVLVATGHAMLGISLAPVTGRLIAELAIGARHPDQLVGVSTNRF